jgi:hypothetical protein
VHRIDNDEDSDEDVSDSEFIVRKSKNGKKKRKSEASVAAAVVVVGSVDDEDDEPIVPKKKQSKMNSNGNRSQGVVKKSVNKNEGSSKGKASSVPLRKQK